MTDPSHPAWLCPRCKRRSREVIDGETQWFCGDCNDREAERYRERQEWSHYHPTGSDDLEHLDGMLDDRGREQ